MSPREGGLRSLGYSTAAAAAGQVEQKRLSIPTDVPCAVQQWNGLIAVSYAARAAGAATLTWPSAVSHRLPLDKQLRFAVVCRHHTAHACRRGQAHVP